MCSGKTQRRSIIGRQSPHLEKLLKHRSALVRRAAVIALGKIHSHEAQDLLLPMVYDIDEHVSWVCRF
jgi:HEAT repeat protein